MRATAYSCDQCQKIFGNKVHLSMNFAQYSGVAIPPGHPGGILNTWHVKGGVANKFLHFCNTDHMKAYFDKMIADVTGETVQKSKKKK